MDVHSGGYESLLLGYSNVRVGETAPQVCGKLREQLCG
jgi:hypothetical protein